MAPAYIHKSVNVDILIKEEEVIKKSYEAPQDKPTTEKLPRNTYRAQVIPSPSKNKIDADDQVI